MKPMRFLASLLTALPIISSAAFAQSTVTTEKTVETAPPQVQTRTWEKDGKTITETVTTSTVREAVGATKTYRAAIIAANRAGRDYDNKLPVLEDLVSARIADLGIITISREVAVDAARKFDPALASSPRPADSLDTQLSNQTSALRLAQGLGVDYLVQVSLTSVGKTQRSIKAYGNELNSTEWTALVTYKILDGTTGGALTGDTVRATRAEQAMANTGIVIDGILDGLLLDASQQIAEGLRARIAANRIAPPRAAAGLVTLTIAPEAADVYIPDVRIGEENTVTLSGSKYKVTPLNVTVEIDGVTVGTAPGKVQVRPGFSKLRLTREGFRPWERTINAVDGQTLTAALAMDDAGYARWAETTAFINDLKNGAKLTDAQVKAIEGLARMFEQSGFKVDTDENFKFIVPGTYTEH
ncbi:hypothetical protein OPIT5_06770 [Opitutaceae bacterium TAV5]|nr:hypothetical protein OPIT5_06770 [Opitutaceae bacterium TAV5]